ncbi:hypothetical protein [Mycolicibacterium llatzerense]|uniref:hypothetical protein n=1 Tax=Mycolicibacterium llatzerense TaxID=280871 RepID=UPI0021B6453A|nr:hypothetical protein [Mycolicibacterium llatzerense]MCT7369328.1 hypothetical protein [Mycolicibacterium llatzerense]
MILQTECKHCTVPVDTGDVCTFCKTYTPPLEADALLAEADQLLAADPLVYPLAARIAHGSPAFPLTGGWSCYVTEVEKSRFTITATKRDPQTGETVNREFVVAVLEMTA